MANNSSAQTVQLNLKINGSDAFNTLKDLNAHLAATQGKVIKMNRDDPSYANMSKHLRDLKEKQKAWNNEIYSGQKAAKNFFDNFKSGLAGIAGAVSVGTLIAGGMQSAMSAVTSFFTNAQAASTKGEQMQAQLAQAIKSTGGAAGITRDRLNELSAALAHQTGISKSAIAESQALLLTFTEIGGEIYDQTLPLIADMSKAFSQDLFTSTIQVGKALNDPILGLTALRKIGVSFSESQAQVIHKLQETGDLAGAQKVILKELAREFGGVAEAVSNTNSGKLESFNTRIGAIQASVGRLITEMKAASLSGLEPFVRLLEKATATNMPAKLREEQAELNTLVGAISMTNNNQAVRNQLISELQAKYPDFLGNIKKEDASNELLERRLIAVNNQYREKIFIATNEEKITEIREKRNKATTEEAEARMRVAKYTGLSAEALAKLNDKQLEEIAIKKQNETLLNGGIGAAMGGLGAMVMGGLNAAKAIKDVDAIVNSRQKITDSLKEENDLIAANAIYSDKVKTGRLKDIDDEIAKLKALNEVKNEAEIARLEGEKNTLLGISSKQKTEHALTEEEKKKAAELKAAKEKALHEFEKLGDEYKKLKITQFQDSLAANEKEIQQEKDKYQALIEEREKYLKNPNINKEQKQEVKAQISTLQKDRETSVNTIEVRQEQDRITQLTELRAQFHVIKEKEVEKEIKLINKKYAELKEKAKGNAKAIALLEGYQATDLANVKIREEQRFQHEKKALQASGLTSMSSKEEQELADIQNKYDAKIELLKESFSEELQLTQEFQDQLAAIITAKNKEVTDKKKEEAKKVTDFLISATQETVDTVFSIASSNRQAESQAHIGEINRQREAELSNKDLTEEQKKAINAKYAKQIAAEKLRAWQADKDASLGQAFINGALAVTKYWAMAQPWMAAIAGATAVAQMVKIDSQKAPNFYGEKGGIIPQGPLHKNGGIALIDPMGRKVGEIEGGEPIISRKTYAEHRELIDDLLYRPHRLKQFRTEIKMREAISGDRMFRNGGIAPTTVNNTTHQVTNHATDLSILVQKFDELKAAVQEGNSRPIEFNYRVMEAFRDKIESVRAGVEA